MEYTQKHQPILRVEMSTPIEIKTSSTPKRIDVYDKASAEFRRHLASEDAIRQLEHRKSLSATVIYRMSFMR